MASSISRVLLFLSLYALLLAAHSAEDAPETSLSHVLTLDGANFDETVAKHDFLVVEFYAPWCGHCKSLEPEYEAAAAALSKHDPPIALAKVDADDQANKELASKYDVSGYPTLKILRNKGQQVQEYNGPREADGIVEYLMKQSGPASVEIKSADNVIDEKKVFIVGIFPEYSGEEYKNFMTVAEKMRSEYDFGHTLEAKFLPKGEPSVKAPTVRLLKPFDELAVDFQDFDVDALEKFISESSVPLVTIFNNDPSNQPYVMKFFNNENAKAMFFLNFSCENFEQFKSQYIEVAATYTKEKISFLMGDLEASDGAFQYFSLKEDQVPLIIIQSNDGGKYLKTNLQPLDIAAWIKEYMDGKAKPFKKSEPIPEVNNEPVKVVVGDNIHDFVLGSGKNVLIEFYAPWCGHCQQLAPILEEVAISFEKDPDVIIAKLDATANDVPKEFDVQGFPTMYFSSASGKLVNYDGGRSKEDIIEFIQANRDVIQTAVETDSPKDEL